MGAETRKRGREFEGEEEIKSHVREERAEAPERGETERETLSGVGAEIVGEARERRQIDFYIAGWNLYIQEKFGSGASSKLVSQRDFLEATGLPAKFKLDFEDFKNILGKYYKFRKIPMDRFSESIDEFFEKKIKPEK